MAKNKKKQHSITTQITLTIVGLVAGTVLLCWLLNVTLLEGYYTRYKQEVLENGFQQINAASEQGILNTPDCLDIIPFFAHLATQLFHMGIDGSGITEIIIIPYMIQNFLTG